MAKTPGSRNLSTPSTFIVLLRGVNVGKAKRVPMAEFRVVLEQLGYGAVRTLLNSGNAVVQAMPADPDALAQAIAGRLQTRFGFEVPVVVKSAGTLRQIIEANTLAPGFDPARLLVVFARDASAPGATGTLGPLLAGDERLLIGQHAAYLYCANGINGSKAAEALLGRAGNGVTTRNWATVMKLAALAPSCGGA